MHPFLCRVWILFSLVCFGLAAYPTNTNTLYNELSECSVDSQSDIDCLTTVNDQLKDISDKLEKVELNLLWWLCTSMTSPIQLLQTLVHYLFC